MNHLCDIWNNTKMTDGFKILWYDESKWLDKNGTNWIFWKTRIIPYLKGSKLWPYVSGTIPKPGDTNTNKLARWEELNAQALSTILMNVTPNVQARLDCSSAKTAWDGLLNQYAQTDPIAQNLAQTRLRTKHFIEGRPETLPAHISELQRLHETCCQLSLSLPDYVISARHRVKGCDQCSGSSSAWSLRIPTAPVGYCPYQLLIFWDISSCCFVISVSPTEDQALRTTPHSIYIILLSVSTLIPCLIECQKPTGPPLVKMGHFCDHYLKASSSSSNTFISRTNTFLPTLIISRTT